jgi:hypothetical protein
VETQRAARGKGAKTKVKARAKEKCVCVFHVAVLSSDENKSKVPGINTHIYITAVKSSVNDTVHADKRRKQNKKTITATPQQQQQQEVRCTHKSPSRTGKRAERGKERRCNVGIDLTFLSIILAVVVNLQWHTDVHSYTSFFF